MIRNSEILAFPLHTVKVRAERPGRVRGGRLVTPQNAEEILRAAPIAYDHAQREIREQRIRVERLENSHDQIMARMKILERNSAEFLRLCIESQILEERIIGAHHRLRLARNEANRIAYRWRLARRLSR